VGVMIGRFAYSSAMICRSCGAGRVTVAWKDQSVRKLFGSTASCFMRMPTRRGAGIDLPRPSRCSATSRNARRLVPKAGDVGWAGVVVTNESLVQSIRQLRQKLGDQDHRLINSRAPSAILGAARGPEHGSL
jgi:hypothetical protein